MYRINRLLKDSQQLFHTRDLSLLWGMENDNTLYTTIKRYVKSGILIPVYKGFYSTIPPEQIDPILLGIVALRGYVYLSCESVLSANGIIFQSVPFITLVSDKSKKFSIGKHNFLSRSLKDIHLYNESGIIGENSVRKASVERAVADMLYFRPRYHFDNLKGLDMKKVKLIRKEVGYIS